METLLKFLLTPAGQVAAGLGATVAAALGGVAFLALCRRVGVAPGEVLALVQRHKPDALLAQALPLVEVARTTKLTRDDAVALLANKTPLTATQARALVTAPAAHAAAVALAGGGKKEIKKALQRGLRAELHGLLKL